MKKKTLLLGVLLATLLPEAKADVDPNFYFYICFGQSNMEGNAPWETIDNTVDARFQLLATTDFTSPSRTKGNLYKALPPLVSPWGKLGPSDYFGRTMVAALPTTVKVGVIPVAMGGSPIEMFDKDKYKQKMKDNPNELWTNLANQYYGGNPYGRIIEMAKIAQKKGVIKGILLHQGCTNCGDPNWPSMVKKIYNDMLKDLNLGADSVPLFVGEVEYKGAGTNPESGACASHNEQVARIPQVIPTGHVISAKGCPGNNEDPWHFSALGYRMLGYRYALSALAQMGVTPTHLLFFQGAVMPNAKSTYNQTSRTMTASEKGGTVSWTYTEGIDWSGYKYLVIKLKSKQTADASIILCNLTNTAIAFKEAIGDRTMMAVDLQTAQYNNKKLEVSKVGKLIVSAGQAGKVVFDEIFLSNDEAYAATAIRSVKNDSPFQAPLYSLDGRLAQPDALRPGIYIKAGKKIVIK